MKNPFVFSDSNKRYYTFDYYLKNKYGQKVFKVSLNAPFSCPNRDGTKDTKGCIFCSINGSGDFAGNKNLSLLEQFEDGIKQMRKKWENGLAMAYFQSFSNTYGSVDKLKEIYEPFISLDNCVAICIATRPDCFNEEIYNYLESINKRKDLYVELGLQTTNDMTGKIINRCYDFSDFKNALANLVKRNIKVTVHIINGLPNETRVDMLKTIKDLSPLPIFGIKFHCLNVLKNTYLGQNYENLNLKILEKDEYLNILSEQIALLPNNIVVERINTDSKRIDLIAPKWNDKKVSISNDFDKLLIKKDYYQGKFAKKYSNYVLFSHLLASFNDKYNLAVDATLGNGFDSLFLVHHYKEVIGFDIQDLALKRSNEKLSGYNNIKMIKDNYINIYKYIDKEIDLLIYNLGFLPGSDHSVVTNYLDTIMSLEKTLPLLSIMGKCIVVSYTMHDDGLEFSKIIEFLDKNKYKYILTDFDYTKVIEIKRA